MAGNRIMTEIAAQPECWRRAAGLAGGLRDALPARGERVAVVGCGTSLYMAQAYAALREGAGHGETDAFAASEMPPGRRYDRVLALTRSGTTTEVLAVLDRLAGSVPTTAITADPDTPVSGKAGRLIVLDFADEESVVQTRFATTQLALLRAHLGEDLTAAIAAAEAAVADPVPPGLLDVEQITFLGRGWTVGLAHEAALKMREAACFWTEAYPAMEYRHGPISITGPGRAVWMFGGLPDGLGEEVAATGGLLRAADADPLAELVRVQRLAVARASAAGLDPERPRHLTRSVVLDAGPGGPAA
ncbi:sugar isomerase [Actinomadura sp. NPDC048955]|uniref:SIS domain-containing protein n=1 Tax=Actinomadura sp. NPDC048955 TaxID=3158228 RepID=UPI00340E16FA